MHIVFCVQLYVLFRILSCILLKFSCLYFSVFTWVHCVVFHILFRGLLRVLMYALFHSLFYFLPSRIWVRLRLFILGFVRDLMYNRPVLYPSRTLYSVFNYMFYSICTLSCILFYFSCLYFLCLLEYIVSCFIFYSMVCWVLWCVSYSTYYSIFTITDMRMTTTFYCRFCSRPCV